jgi:ankyrin repeat protein
MSGPVVGKSWESVPVTCTLLVDDTAAGVIRIEACRRGPHRYLRFRPTPPISEVVFVLDGGMVSGDHDFVMHDITLHFETGEERDCFASEYAIAQSAELALRSRETERLRKALPTLADPSQPLKAPGSCRPERGDREEDEGEGDLAEGGEEVAECMTALALACATGVEELKQALGGRNPNLQVAPGWLPDCLARRTKRLGLIEIAAGAARVDSLSFLMHFCGIRPTPEAMRQAVASGNVDIQRDIWTRLEVAERTDGLVSFAEVAIKFSNPTAFEWLVGQADAAQREEIANTAIELRRVDAIATLLDAGLDLTGCGLGVARTLAKWPELLGLVRLARADSWAAAFVSSAVDVRRALMLRAPPVPPEFERLIQAGDPAATTAYLASRCREGDLPDRSWRPLMEALCVYPGAADSESMAALFAAGFGPACEAAWGLGALGAAAHAGNLRRVELLIAKGEAVDVPGPTGEFPLELASTAPVARALLAAGARPNSLNARTGLAPMHRAVGRSCAEVVKVLIEAGADVGAPVGDVAPICLAVVPEVAELLVAAGADVNSVGPYGRTALLAAVESGHVAQVETLLRLGADVTVGSSPLVTAAGRASVPLMQALMAAGADPLDPDVICMAAGSTKVEPVEFLLDLGADPNCIGRSYGATPLQWSVGMVDGMAVTALLLARGADVNLAGSNGTPLSEAVHSPDVVRQLLAAGADQNGSDSRGTTPLMAAVRRVGCCEECGWDPGGPEETVELLLEAGANPCAKTTDGVTALSYIYEPYRQRIERAMAEWEAAHAK